MVITMTNRLLGIVMALALSSGIVAHAAQAPQRPLISLPAIQTAASHVGETATGAIDPGAAIRSAYQRNQVALEHLRQQASPLKGSARLAFYQFVSEQEAALTQTQRTALATRRPAVSSSIAAMDRLLTEAEDELNHELSQPSSAKSTGSGSARSNGSHRAGASAGDGEGGSSQSNNKPGDSGASHGSDD
jgi:hypothetical protein